MRMQQTHAILLCLKFVIHVFQVVNHVADPRFLHSFILVYATFMRDLLSHFTSFFLFF